MNKESLIRKSDATIPRLCRCVERSPDFFEKPFENISKELPLFPAEHYEIKLHSHKQFLRIYKI